MGKITRDASKGRKGAQEERGRGKEESGRGVQAGQEDG
jgi:hypothetical protein